VLAATVVPAINIPGKISPVNPEATVRTVRAIEPVKAADLEATDTPLDISVVARRIGYSVVTLPPA
jgi:hypothetical protein